MTLNRSSVPSRRFISKLEFLRVCARTSFHQQRWEAAMAGAGRPTAEVELTDDERDTLERWA